MPLAASNSQAQLIDLPAMPESNNTSNPERSDPENTGAHCPVDHGTGNGTESVHDGRASEAHRQDEIGETPAGLRLGSQASPSETSGQHLPTTILASTPREISALSPSVTVVQNSFPEEVRQGSRRQLTTHGDAGSASERQPHLALSSVAEAALAAAVQATSSLDPEFSGHFGATRPSASAQPPPARAGNETTWTPFSQAHARVALPPLGAVLRGVGQERVNEWDLIPGTSSPTFDSLMAPRAPPLPLHSAGLLPRLLPRLLLGQNTHDNESSPADSDGQYSCPGCSKRFNRMTIRDSHCEKKHGIKPPQKELRSS